MRVLIVADDFSGACDSAIHFAALGMPTFASFDLAACAASGADVVAYCTSTRDADEAAARSRTGDAFRILGAPVLYKKIDSVLRGHVRAEIEEALRASGRTEAWVCPAYPALGRDSRAAEVRQMLQGCGTAIEADTTEALRARAADALRAEPHPLLAGSGGWARELAALLGGERDRATPPGASVPPRRAGAVRIEPPLLLIVGSDHPVTLAQIEALRAAAGGAAAREPMLSATGSAPATPCGPASYHVEVIDLRTVTGERLRRLHDAVQPQSIFLCGGDTAEFGLRALGVSGAWLETEVLPGVPLGRFDDGRALITKSGGFGPPNTLLKLVRCVHTGAEDAAQKQVPG